MAYSNEFQTKDICSVDGLTDDKINEILYTNFLNSSFYTNIGSNSIIAVNSFKESVQDDSQTSDDYIKLYKYSSIDSSNTIKYDPHIFELTNRAYFHMRRVGNDQTIFLCGKHGSGKSKFFNLIIRHLLGLGSNKKSKRLTAQILNGLKVLQAFGSANTSNHFSASCFGLYTETLYNQRGKVVGAKLLHYFLEKSRLTGGKKSESNFNVFYWLLAGAESDEKQLLQLKEDTKEYHYLEKYGRHIGPSDSKSYNDLKVAMRKSGFENRNINCIIQLLAAILHLGNIEFLNSDGLDDDGSIKIKDPELLEMVADLLNVNSNSLEIVLKYKTTMIGNDVTTLILDIDQALLQRDKLAETLYSLLFSWIVEHLNQKINTDDFNSIIGVLDFPGSQLSGQSFVGFEEFCINYTNEILYNYLMNRIFKSDDQEIAMGDFEYNDNEECIKLFNKPSRGICAILNKMSDKTSNAKRIFTDINIVDALNKYNSDKDLLLFKNSETGSRQFAIQHFIGEVTYEPTGFISKNNNKLPVDFVGLFFGNVDMPKSWSSFTVDLFSKENLANGGHYVNELTVSNNLNQNVKPTRLPSMRKSIRSKKGNIEKSDVSSNGNRKTVLGQIRYSLNHLINSFQEAMIWSVFCIQPNTTGDIIHFDKTTALSQIKALGLKSIASKAQKTYIISFLHQEFLSRYTLPFNNMGMQQNETVQEQCNSVKVLNNWNNSQMLIGSTKVFLDYESWRFLEEILRNYEKQETKNSKILDKDIQGSNEDSSTIQTERNKKTIGLYDSKISPDTTYRMQSRVEGSEIQYSVYSGDDPHYQHSYRPEEYYQQSYYSPMSQSYTHQEGFKINDTLSQQMESSQPNTEEEEPSISMTPARKRWLFFVWAITWWIPNLFLAKCGRMKRKDVRIAWREKFALCTIIVFMCAFVIWFLVFFGDTICPNQHLYSSSELASHNSDSDGYIAINGEVFNLGNFASHHYPSLVPVSAVLEYAGTDVSDLFPLQVSDLCEGVSPYVSLDYNINYTDSNAQYHDFRYSSEDYRKDWYYQQMTMLRRNYKVGNMATDWKSISEQANGAYTLNGMTISRNWAVIDEYIYDLTTYILGGRYLRAPPGETVPSGISTDFLDISVVNLFQQNAGSDITQKFESLSLTPEQKNRELVCLRNLYFKGYVDQRNSTKCQFSTYFLLTITICLCLVILFKFFAAIRIGTHRVPEEREKFVICQVTCYTEDEESLRKTIDSLATTHYDDKRKLIVVICDGMIIGSGNDRPTPRIVLDIFGVNPQIDPEPLSFISVGEGAKQHNRAKIYSGLYEISGHVIPYLVIAKVGAPNEHQKPGNRGKRDSQLILMQFLNRVHYDAPMNPMQLEIYHQMRNVIGVSPEMYEFVLMMDADTEVMPDGILYLVSSMAHDAKIIGICGETTLANEKDTWVTMIQVYEYFISHHMIKSFESLFSTVSCLPGCFTMYRIRTADAKRPLFVCNEIIDDYKINVVDTLHKKNLLYLGEDRYLTTLLLKHFPKYKTKFNPDAKCKTNAPDTWNVLISQRRRWINSTVHNLGELVFLPGLCGFCCFSMRFVVMLDLISTLVQPALLGYLGFLIYKLVEAQNQIPYITIITLACTYGLQVLLFIIYGRWEYIAWFFFSILALPVFSFYIPIYSYWHFDDFSWGNTRIVVGEKGKKKVMGDEGEFDPKSVPLMPWSQYERTVLTDMFSQTNSVPPLSLNDMYSRNMEYSNYEGYSANGYSVNGDYPIYGYLMTEQPDSVASGRNRQQENSVINPEYEQ